MADKSPAPTQTLPERFSANQQKNAWQHTILTGVVVLIVILALVSYGIPDGKSDPGDVVVGAIVLSMLYLVFIRKRTQDVDANTLVSILRYEWRSGGLGSAIHDRLEFSLENVLIEQLSDDFWLISCNNPYGGTKTLAVRGTDARALRVVDIYSGNAAETRKLLEKNEFVRGAVAKGHTMREIEALSEKLGA